MIPETIETRTPQNLPPLAKRQDEFSQMLNSYVLDDLQNIFFSFSGTKPKAKRKADIITEFAALLAFPSIDDFHSWFAHISPLGKRILWKTTFNRFIPLRDLESELGQQLTVQQKDRWWLRISFLPELNLNYLTIESTFDQLVVSIPALYRKAVLPWLVPPPEGELENCVFQRPEEQVKPWNNSIAIAESYPLFCEALNSIILSLQKDEQEKIIRSGLKKKDAKELYASSGLLHFEKANDGPDSADMLGRFALCMNALKFSRPEDGHAAIKKMVKDFFSPVSKHSYLWYYSDSNFLEYTLLIDHLNRTPGYYLDASTTIPNSRKVFHDLLMRIALDGRRFNADKLADFIVYSNDNFSFCEKNLEQTLKIRAESLDIGGHTFQKEYYNEFNVEGILRNELLIKPVFKAYCFLCAILGLLEITLKDPPLKRSYHDKMYPISIYDSLESVRITEFGLWCLDLTKKQPPRPKHSYQAIADKELFLVTVQGNSLERTVFLDRIGEKLGADRWRISPASFIEGCVSKNQIIDRVNRFKRLIDGNPSPHWLDLFKKVTERAGLFDANRLEALVFTLPDDQEVNRELLEDPDLRKIAMRAEGRLLVVPLKNQKKFLGLLSRHGIASLTII
jgi:hypothetical protein